MSMNSRELWIAAGKNAEVDRIPFHPKLSGSYVVQHGGKLSEHFDYIGNDRLAMLKNIFKPVYRDSRFEVEKKGNMRYEKYITPIGTAVKEIAYDAGSDSVHPVKMPIVDEESLKIMIRYFRDLDFEVDHDAVLENIARNKISLAATRENMGTSPLMEYLEELAGIEDGNYLLMDEPELVEELMDVMDEKLTRKIELAIEHSVADFWFFVENTSTTYISPTQFDDYCVDRLKNYAKLIKEARGEQVNVTFHMCGKLSLLLDTLNTLGNDTFEAVTAPSIGDTPIYLAREKMPNKCIIGGTDANVWTKPQNEIIAYIEEALDRLPHHRGIILSSAGQMPPMCSPETLKGVCDWLKTYKPRM